MNFTNKLIGIWGFGVVGKSAAYYVAKAGATVSIIDKRPLNEAERELVTKLKASHTVTHDAREINEWLARQDFIIASPGIDLRPYAAYRDRFIAELDLFYHGFQRPIMAVTGSVGKTTVTHLLSQLLPDRFSNLWTGGNIGTGMLDALQSLEADAALLELSSFQLEPCIHFAPDLAIVTNIHKNHLDRHGTMESYTNAKKQIILHQKTGQQALLPLSCRNWANQTNATVHFFAEHETEIDLPAEAAFFFIRDGMIIQRTSTEENALVSITDLPPITFSENLLIITAVLKLLGIPFTTLRSHLETVKLPAHRLELVATIRGVSFYDDSKATTTAATAAAIQQLSKTGRPIILMMGGLGKGIDRTPLIASLKNKVSFIYCFGKEREDLAAACKTHDIPHAICGTIDEIIPHYWPQAQSGDQLLLSPAGTSYDQFKDYEERGNYFKQRITKLC